jgi:hypothetical protein
VEGAFTEDVLINETLPHADRRAIKSFERESRGKTFSKVFPLAAGGITHE